MSNNINVEDNVEVNANNSALSAANLKSHFIDRNINNSNLLNSKKSNSRSTSRDNSLFKTQKLVHSTLILETGVEANTSHNQVGSFMRPNSSTDTKPSEDKASFTFQNRRFDNQGTKDDALTKNTPPSASPNRGKLQAL